MTAKLLAEDVMPKHTLAVDRSYFWCPYCAHRFERGGHKEGFVKSGARNHVFTCWEVCLFLRGYVVGDWTARGHLALPVDKAHPKCVRALKANVRTRKRAGVLEALSPRKLPSWCANEAHSHRLHMNNGACYLEQKSRVGPVTPRRIRASEMIACIACGRVVRGYAPKGGDGSALFAYRHAPKNRLSGSMRSARERSGTWGICDGSNQRGATP